ncbi:MAG: MgtC/SapB family protein [Rhodobacteraceae bacterium]|jgi:putative Mg2+ transporter-C (MgtC) family protein|nr:MgtC/SapB family protein [Paracoccaceae bacterium]
MDSLLIDITTFASLPWQVVVGRLLGAVFLCGVIGFEREARNRPAGLRTHMMVGLAAALYCLIMLETLADSELYTDRVAMDPLRLIEAVTGGVAFLAAGMIVFSKGKVHGLTTGTSLWLAAGVGLGMGFGLWLMTSIATGLALIIIRGVKIAEDRMPVGADDPDRADPEQ